MTLTQKLQALCIPASEGRPGSVYTPLAPDFHTRLRFRAEDVKTIRRQTETQAGIVEIKGERYRVVAADCGLQCKCDAVLTGRYKGAKV